MAKDFIELLDGEISITSNNLLFKEMSNVLINNVVSKDTVINYTFDKDIIIEETILLQNEATLTVNINVLNQAKVKINRLITSNSCNVKMVVQTNLEQSTYIDNSSIILLSDSGNISEVITLKKDAIYDNINVIINKTNKKQNYLVNVLMGEEQSESNIINYSICKGDSILNVDTIGTIKKNAKRTNLQQKTKGLLLSDTSAISANPQLIIDEYDCLASHGAGIGAIDEEELYYLMSRGLTREESEKLIINGFVKPVISKIEDEDFKRNIQVEIEKYL